MRGQAVRLNHAVRFDALIVVNASADVTRYRIKSTKPPVEYAYSSCLGSTGRNPRDSAGDPIFKRVITPASVLNNVFEEWRVGRNCSRNLPPATS